ncbi:DUF2383 domain-containing protein [Mucilaginibacter pedocola]|uniref:DUF2383 domain-containing protein n=1 Tax=Mucilaginibacter pedocola TaxID=1792845 RepID=UPI001EE440F4|nr:DUF2383 domain-containing protein [Mucilaginibacter pedocola]
MTATENAIGVINGLIEINNDRIAGIEKAIADIKDENIDLKQLFQGYAEQSRKNGQELAAIVGSTKEVEPGNSISGTLHRAWIDVRSLFGGSGRKVYYRKRNAAKMPLKKLTMKL